MKGTKMKTIIFFTFVFLITAQAQTVYNLQPGTKSNRIELTVSNISKTKAAQNVRVDLLKKSSSITFKNETKTIANIGPQKEMEIAFQFDVKRSAPVNMKDTVSFKISNENGIMALRSFIFYYSAPKEFRLDQNFPNPFNPTTIIQYQLPRDSRVTLKVYDILGREVTTLVNKEEKAGYKEVRFNGSRYASGVYIYRLIAESKGNNYMSVKKMMMVK
jgi:Secretion system C-terminal sorting domain